MGAEDEFRAVGEEVLDGFDGSLDAGVIGDDAVFERDVEVDTHEDFLVVNVEIADGELGHGAGRTPETGPGVKPSVGAGGVMVHR